jgi:hypothetical protein
MQRTRVLDALRSMPMTTPAVSPLVLIVRDGWGTNPNKEHDAFNAVKLAKTPVAEKLMREYPWTWACPMAPWATAKWGTRILAQAASLIKKASRSPRPAAVGSQADQAATQ